MKKEEDKDKEWADCDDRVDILDELLEELTLTWEISEIDSASAVRRNSKRIESPKTTEFFS